MRMQPGHVRNSVGYFLQLGLASKKYMPIADYSRLQHHNNLVFEPVCDSHTVNFQNHCMRMQPGRVRYSMGYFLQLGLAGKKYMPIADCSRLQQVAADCSTTIDL